jgi:hypothetical protein
MSYSRNNSKASFNFVAVLISMAALASWQFYKYATFKYDSPILNIEGGVSHLVWALFLAFLACSLVFFMALRLLRYEADDQLHITSLPGRRNSLKTW